MSRVLGWGNLMIGGLLLFALSDIAWSWFASPTSRLIVFILSVLLIGNAVMLAFFENEAISERRG
jgi:Ca2+/H+ antiporter